MTVDSVLASSWHEKTMNNVRVFRFHAKTTGYLWLWTICVYIGDMKRPWCTGCEQCACISVSCEDYGIIMIVNNMSVYRWHRKITRYWLWTMSMCLGDMGRHGIIMWTISVYIGDMGRHGINMWTISVYIGDHDVLIVNHDVLIVNNVHVFRWHGKRTG